jgi:ABC-2 type transport system ATP-binding protein
MQEVEAIATRVLFINEGRLVFDGRPGELTQEGISLDQRFHKLTEAEPA